MRSVICVSCGKTTTVNSCTGQSCRDMICPECGGRMVRDHSAGSPGIVGNSNNASSIQGNTFTFGSGGRNAGRGMRCRGRKGHCGRAV